MNSHAISSHRQSGDINRQCEIISRRSQQLLTELNSRHLLWIATPSPASPVCTGCPRAPWSPVGNLLRGNSEELPWPPKWQPSWQIPALFWGVRIRLESLVPTTLVFCNSFQPSSTGRMCTPHASQPHCDVPLPLPKQTSWWKLPACMFRIRILSRRSCICPVADRVPSGH